MKYEFGNGTDKGCVRARNEDTFVLYQPQNARQTMKKGYLMVVCDGMGGAKAGKLASSLAAEEIPRHYYTRDIDDPRSALVSALQNANKHVWRKSNESDDQHGMGTTAVVAAILDNVAYVAHVGDSRCYHCIPKGTIHQVTEDHTVVQRMLNRGVITGDEAENHTERHMLSRAIGVDVHVEVDITMEGIRLRSGEALVLCSDGLTNVVNEDEIHQIVTTKAPQKAVDKLIQLAKDRGGPDNITVQVLRCTNGEYKIEDNQVTTIRTAPLSPISRQMAIGLFALLALSLSAFLLWLFIVY